MLIQRLKRLENKVIGSNKYYVFFGNPTKAELNKLPENAEVIIFIGEENIQD